MAALLVPVGLVKSAVKDNDKFEGFSINEGSHTYSFDAPPYPYDGDSGDFYCWTPKGKNYVWSGCHWLEV